MRICCKKMQQTVHNKQWAEVLAEHYASQLRSLRYFTRGDDGALVETGALPDPSSDHFPKERHRREYEIQFVRSITPFVQYWLAETELEKAGFMETVYMSLLRHNKQQLRMQGVVSDHTGHEIGTDKIEKLKRFEAFKTWFSTISEKIARELKL